MAKLMLKDGKLQPVKGRAQPQQQAPQQAPQQVAQPQVQQPQQPMQPQAQQPQQAPDELPPFPMEQPQQEAQVQQQEDIILEVVFHMMNGMTYTVPLPSAEVSEFAQKVDKAINEQTLMDLGPMKFSGRHIVMYSVQPQEQQQQG